MMFEIRLSKSALKFLRKNPQKDRIKTKLFLLANNPFQNSLDIKPLKSMEGYLRMRMGDVRIIFFVNKNQKIIQVLEIDNRGDIY